MIEYEIKLTVNDSRAVRPILEDHGFIYVDTCTEVDFYYSHPCRDFRETDEAFRFRMRKCNREVTYTVTYKGPRGGSSTLKIREELETMVDEGTWRSLRAIMEKLGFGIVMGFMKKREIYDKHGLRAYIDYLMEVGHYVEVELVDQSYLGELKELINVLEKVLKARIENRTYLEICLETLKCSLIEEQ